MCTPACRFSVTVFIIAHTKPSQQAYNARMTSSVRRCVPPRFFTRILSICGCDVESKFIQRCFSVMCVRDIEVIEKTIKTVFDYILLYVACICLCIM